MKRTWDIPETETENLRNFWMQFAFMFLALASIIRFENTGEWWNLIGLINAKWSNDYRMKNNILDWPETFPKIQWRNDPRWSNLK